MNMEYKYTVDFKDVRYYTDIHDAIKRGLDFPEYYGTNLDAMWDCLTDTVLSGNCEITFLNFDRVEKINKEYAEKIECVLKRLVSLYHGKNGKTVKVFIRKNN